MTDITEIKPQQGKLYLCIVRYLYDQRVVGCSQWCVPWGGGYEMSALNC